MRICSVPNCGLIHYAKTFCHRHWVQWRAHGDPLVMGRAPNGAGFTKAGYAAFKEGQRMVFVHRRVMELHIGRPLLPTEVVHHINEDKTDNRIENLELLEPSSHAKIHRLRRPHSNRRKR